MAVTHYLWDTESDNVLTEFDDSFDTTAVYTNEPTQFGDLVSQHRDTATSWYHSDGLGSTRELTDNTETVTDTNIYDAWGNDLESTGTTEYSYRWVGAKGYYYDTELGSYYVRARTYKPTIARWTAHDPICCSPSSIELLPVYIKFTANPDRSEWRTLGEHDHSKCLVLRRKLVRSRIW